MVLFFHKLNPFSPKKTQGEKKDTWDLWFKVIVAIIPSGIVGVLLDDWMEAHLHTAVVVSLALIIYGVAFILVERRNKNLAPKVGSVWNIDWRLALGIGLFQCLSLIPGTSRSGSTILGAILLGVGRSAGAEFSFFLAIPTMVGVSILKLGKFFAEKLMAGEPVFTGEEAAILAVGFVVSFVVSVVCIRFLMNFVKKHDFKIFGWYRIVLGALVLLFFGVQALLAH